MRWSAFRSLGVCVYAYAAKLENDIASQIRISDFANIDHRCWDDELRTRRRMDGWCGLARPDNGSHDVDIPPLLRKQLHVSGRVPWSLHWCTKTRMAVGR